jgi:hypothetical protein
MLEGPKGHKRPADVIGNAVLVAKIAGLQPARTSTQRAGK